MSSTRRRRRLTPRYIVMCVAMLWVCTAIAATAFWPVYESAAFVIMVAVTTIVGSTIAVIGAIYRLQSHLVGVVVLIAYLLLGVPLAVPAQTVGGLLPTLEGMRSLLLATALGWKRLLTITLPVGSYEALLVPAFICVLVTVTVSLSIALRARRGELAVLGPIALLILALMFGPTSTFFPHTVSLGLAGSVLIWIMLIRAARRRGQLMRSGAQDESTGGRRDDRVRSGIRVVVSALVILLIAAGGAVGATALVPPSAEREVLRSSIVQPFDPRAYASPLSGFRGYHQSDRRDSAMLTVEGLPPDARIRIATLDSYNGVVYRVGGESEAFTRVPSQFDQSVVVGRQVSVVVTVDGYRGVWVPTVGRFESISFGGGDASPLRASFYYNDNSATAAVLGRLETGDRYRLRAIVPDEPEETELASMTPGGAQVPAIDVSPDELSVALDRYTASVSGEGARLMAAIDGLKAEGYVSHGVGDDEPVSRSGHAADRITELFTGTRMIGDEEQYAVAAAIMARELGFPARVVMGFTRETAAESAASADPITFIGSDISAWIEVDTAEYGWVTIDPTPPVRVIPDAVPEDPTQVARPQAPVQPPVEEPVTPDDQVPPDSATNDAPTVDPLLQGLLLAARILGWVAVAAALAVSPFLAIVAAKVRRRALRRRLSSPLDRISEGWWEFEDAVIDHGFEPAPASTRSEFAGLIGGNQPLVLAAAADRASFSPDGPDPREADLVWSAVDDLRVSLDDDLTRWQRTKARISLRSLDRRGAFARSRVRR